MNRSFPNRQAAVSVVFLAGILCSLPSVFAGDMDELYGPLVERGRLLSTSQFSYLTLREDGLHGGSSFDDFEADPEYPSFRQFLQYAPLEGWELLVGYGKDFDANYERPTNATPRDLLFDYDLDFFHHFHFGLRRRFERSELYIESYGNRQKSSWNLPLTAMATAPDFFTVIRSHYEEAEMGWRYVSPEGETQEPDNLSLLTRPLLASGQWTIESSLGYRRGRIERDNQFYSEPPATREYFYDLGGHLTPQMLVAIGVRDDLELRTGIDYELPHTFKFDFHQVNLTLGSDRHIVATYRIHKRVSLPLGLTFRPADDWRVGISADSLFGEQTLDSFDDPFAIGSPTVHFPRKRLRYLNVRPKLELTYLLDRGKTIEAQSVNKLTKRMIRRSQFLLDLEYFRDITHLRKNGANGAANIAEYNSFFLFPLDNFVSGSEYAAHFTGNSSATFPDISPQNYHQAELNVTYGLFDRLNAGLGAGYRSRSGVHQLVFLNSGTSTRRFTFEPMTYFNFFADWQPTQNSLLTVKVHYVPAYSTFMTSSSTSDTKEYEGNTEYTLGEVALHLLF